MMFTQEIIGYINLFEKITNAKVKDCIIDEKITFIVEKGYIGMAIGKGGENIKRAERLLKKKVKVIEFNDNVVEFVKNLIPIKAKEIKLDNNIITIAIDGIKEKGIVIGRNRNNLNELKSIINKYFKIEDIKVV